MGDQQASRRSLRVGGGTGTRAPGRDPTGRPVTKMAERLPRGPAGGRDGSRGGGGGGEARYRETLPPLSEGPARGHWQLFISGVFRPCFQPAVACE